MGKQSRRRQAQHRKRAAAGSLLNPVQTEALSPTGRLTLSPVLLQQVPVRSEFARLLLEKGFRKEVLLVHPHENATKGDR